MRDYWMRLHPPAGDASANTVYVVLHLHYLGTPDSPRFDEIAQVNARFGRSSKAYQFQPHTAVKMGMDMNGHCITGHAEKDAANRDKDTRWMGPSFTPKGWPAGTRDLPPWLWRTDPDRLMADQPAADGLPVVYSPAERQRFRECHELLLDAEAKLQRGFKLTFAKESVSKVLPEGGGGKPFGSPMYWAPFIAVGAVDH